MRGWCGWVAAHLDVGVVQRRQAPLRLQEEARGGLLDPRGVHGGRAAQGLLLRGRLRGGGETRSFRHTETGWCGKHAEEMDPREWRTSATEAGAFLLPLALADALPERISYTVGSELMRLNSFSLRSRRADGRTVSGKIRVVFSGDPEGVRK